jgi:glyoxylate/hydroxypyruvate reductase
MRAVFLSSSLPGAPWADALRRHVPELSLELWPNIADPALIDTALAFDPPPGALARFPNLKFVHALGAGIETLLSDPGLGPEVAIVRLVDPWMTRAMGEYVELQVLRLHRQDFDYRAQQAEALWRERPQPNADERRVGILGLGALGSEAALRLKVLGFDVAGWSRTERPQKGFPCFCGEAGLQALAQRSEILVCLLPLTRETENILDQRLFAAMPKGGSIVNAGRGAHLVEADLLAALDSGQLSGAVLDVFRSEPLPRDHPFWRHPRIIVTPHAAAASNPATAAPIIAGALRRLAAGLRPANLVDRARGY